MRKAEKDPAFFPELPPLDAAAHLIGYLFEVGPMQAQGMGLGPISHSEIRAWQETSGIDLQPWEARFLRKLSGEYVAEVHEAEKQDRPAPWAGAAEQKLVASDLKETIRRMTKL